MRDCGWHLLGTCKMGDDPATSVVDADGRAHDVPNLYVYDGSVFPTSAGVNPTATIAAVSLRCTERLIETRASPGGAGVNALDRERLGALADVLVPAAAGMPSATEAGVHREGLDRVLAARPDLEPVLVRVLASGGRRARRRPAPAPGERRAGLRGADAGSHGRLLHRSGRCAG